MAYCETVSIPGGGTAIVRMSGKPPALCEVCKVRRHTKLCDGMVLNCIGGKHPYASTCDRKMCDQCTKSSGKFDFCPNHKELA